MPGTIHSPIKSETPENQILNYVNKMREITDFAVKKNIILKSPARERDSIHQEIEVEFDRHRLVVTSDEPRDRSKPAIFSASLFLLKGKMEKPLKLISIYGTSGKFADESQEEGAFIKQIFEDLEEKAEGVLVDKSGYLRRLAKSLAQKNPLGDSLQGLLQWGEVVKKLG